MTGRLPISGLGPITGPITGRIPRIGRGPRTGRLPIPGNAGNRPQQPHSERAWVLDAVSVHAVRDRRPLYAPRPENLADHLRRYGGPLRLTPDLASRLPAQLETAELTGHGGGHFPTARKWRIAIAAAASSGRAPVVVANAAEGEPLSAKDVAVLHARPHLVLDGISSTAAALGARAAVIWLHAGAEWLHPGLTEAIQQRRAEGLDPVRIDIRYGPDTYLSGESSAVVRGLDGGPALPRFSRVPSARSGVNGHPTVLHNVETLARTALIARYGAYALGGPDAPSPLLTLADVEHLTVSEPGHGATPADVLAAARGGRGAEPPQAVLVGGYGGQWLGWDVVARRPVADLVGLGASTLGAGVLAPIPYRACGLRETARMLEYLARSSARQCGPCVNGTRAIADRMAALADGDARRRDVDRLLELAGLIDGRGACALPDGAARLAASALSTFADDAHRHARRRPCAGAHAAGLMALPPGVPL